MPDRNFNFSLPVSERSGRLSYLACSTHLQVLASLWVVCIQSLFSVVIYCACQYIHFQAIISIATVQRAEHHSIWPLYVPWLVQGAHIVTQYSHDYLLCWEFLHFGSPFFVPLPPTFNPLSHQPMVQMDTYLMHAYYAKWAMFRWSLELIGDLLGEHESRKCAKQLLLSMPVACGVDR